MRGDFKDRLRLIIEQSRTNYWDDAGPMLKECLVHIIELESAMAARDAVRDKTVRATALRDAAEELGGMLADQKTLRDRADQEEQ